MRVAKIKYFEARAISNRWRIFKRTENPGYHIGHVSVIAPRRAIAINREGLSGFDQSGKFVNGEIGPLARSIDCEEPQTDRRDGIKMRIGAAEHFAGDFCGRVGRDRLKAHLAFDERSFTGGAINGTGRPENKILNSKFAAKIEKIECAGNIDPLIKLRLLDRGAHAGERGKVDDRVGAKGAKNFANAWRVANIGFVEIEAAHSAHVFEIGALPGRRIKTVEGVDNYQLGPAADQGFRQMRANESGAAGQ